MRSAVVLLSSGLDSAANLCLEDDGFKPAAALTIDYGQKGARRELERAAGLARHFGLPHETFDLRGFLKLVGGKSALLGSGPIPSPESLDDLSVTTKSAAAVWVPNRNGVMLSIAAAFAESRGLDAVAVGFNAEEAVTFPDNTVDYMSSVTASLRFSTANHVQVVSSTATLNKREIVSRLAGRDFPFELLWSCYEAGELHCGRCESCKRLHRALETGLPAERAQNAIGVLFGKAKQR